MIALEAIASVTGSLFEHKPGEAGPAGLLTMSRHGLLSGRFLARRVPLGAKRDAKSFT
jgi:hypothetical protein